MIFVCGKYNKITVCLRGTVYIYIYGIIHKKNTEKLNCGCFKCYLKTTVVAATEKAAIFDTPTCEKGLSPEYISISGVR